MKKFSKARFLAIILCVTLIVSAATMLYSCGRTLGKGATSFKVEIIETKDDKDTTTKITVKTDKTTVKDALADTDVNLIKLDSDGNITDIDGKSAGTGKIWQISGGTTTIDGSVTADATYTFKVADKPAVEPDTDDTTQDDQNDEEEEIEGDVFGTGATSITVEVTVNEETQTCTVNTDESTLGAALTQSDVNLIVVDDSGMITEVSGVKADYPADKTWWKITVDGIESEVGVNDILTVANSVYTFELVTDEEETTLGEGEDTTTGEGEETTTGEGEGEGEGEETTTGEGEETTTGEDIALDFDGQPATGE